MKRIRSFCRMMCITMIVTLLVSGAMIPTAALAAAKGECDAFKILDAAWFYVPSTAAYSAEVIEWAVQPAISAQNGSEPVKTCSIEFVSGDEALKNALNYRVITPEQEEGATAQEDTPVLELYVDNDQLKAPGDAVFHVKAESEHCVDERDVALHVISWDDQPLFLTRGGPYILTAKIGDTIENRQIAESAIDLRDQDIIAEFEKEGITIGPDLRRNPLTMVPRGTTILTAWSNMSENPEDYREGYQVLDYGATDTLFRYDKGNVRYEDQVRIEIPGYRIAGPKTVTPGETAQYAIIEEPEGEGRTFALSAEGEGITLDADAWTLTAAEDTPEGTKFTLTATPSDGGDPATLEGKVSSGVIAQETFETTDFREGFSIPLLINEEAYTTGYNRYNGALICETKDETAPYVTTLSYVVLGLGQFMEDPEAAKQIYEQANTEGLQITTDEIVEIDGHPARMVVGNVDAFSIGLLYYARNNRILIVQLNSSPAEETTTGDLPMVTAADMKTIVKQTGYDPAKASVTVDDIPITISARGTEDEAVLSGGQTLSLTASFANPDKVNARARNNTILWAVTDTATGEAPEDVTVDGKGNVSAKKTLADIRKVEVTAFSPIFGTSAVYPITVIPSITKIRTEPERVYFYVGTYKAQTVKAVVEPEKAPTTGLTWKAKQEGIVEITDNQDGTATLKPLAVGKTSVVVTEPGGKKAKFKAIVTEPVTEVKLSISGRNNPGCAVTVREELIPKGVGNKNVEWSLDVGEEIATVSNGMVRISKDAPVGTVITVTCTALGAPEPVKASVQIKVEE